MSHVLEFISQWDPWLQVLSAIGALGVAWRLLRPPFRWLRRIAAPIPDGQSPDSLERAGRVKPLRTAREWQAELDLIERAPSPTPKRAGRIKVKLRPAPAPPAETERRTKFATGGIVSPENFRGSIFETQYPETLIPMPPAKPVPPPNVTVRDWSAVAEPETARDNRHTEHVPHPDPCQALLETLQKGIATAAGKGFSVEKIRVAHADYRMLVKKSHGTAPAVDGLRVFGVPVVRSRAEHESTPAFKWGPKLASEPRCPKCGGETVGQSAVKSFPDRFCPACYHRFDRSGGSA